MALWILSVYQNELKTYSKGDSAMFSLSRNFLKFAAASAFVALVVSGTPTCADEMAQNLGPVGPQGGRSGPPPGSPMPQTNVVVAPAPQALPAPRASQFSTARISQANRPLPQGTPSYGAPSQGAPGQPSSASAAEPSKFCKATAATVGLSAKDRFMAWCEAEARQVSGVPTEPPGPGMGRALRQN
jgi:hypothetical protein